MLLELPNGLKPYGCFLNKACYQKPHSVLKGKGWCGAGRSTRHIQGKGLERTGRRSWQGGHMGRYSFQAGAWVQILPLLSLAQSLWPPQLPPPGVQPAKVPSPTCSSSWAPAWCTVTPAPAPSSQPGGSGGPLPPGGCKSEDRVGLGHVRSQHKAQARPGRSSPNVY